MLGARPPILLTRTPAGFGPCQNCPVATCDLPVAMLATALCSVSLARGSNTHLTSLLLSGHFTFQALSSLSGCGFSVLAPQPLSLGMAQQGSGLGVVIHVHACGDLRVMSLKKKDVFIYLGSIITEAVGERKRESR